MERVAAGEALDRDDLVPVRLRRQHQARAHERAVEEHRARAALALLTGVFRAGQAEPLAERVQQALARPDVRLAGRAVDRERDPHASTRFSARSARTRSAWRR